MARGGPPLVVASRPASLAVAMLALTTGVFALGGSSYADVASVRGTASGYYSNVSLFGGPPSERGPAPTVTLAPDASNSPLDASTPSGDAVYGPAVLFRSGRIDVHTEGVTGPNGSVASSSQVQGHPDPNQRPGPFLFASAASTCTASESGPSASTTISNGIVETKYDPQTQAPVQTQPVPANAPPGHMIEGTLDHVGDSFRIVFNEQVANPDGSLTVNAAHIYLLGPNAVGDLIIGQSICGVTTSTAAGAGEAQKTRGSEPSPTVPAAPGEDVQAGDPDTPAAGRFPSPLVVGVVVVLLAAGVALALVFVRRRQG